MTILRQKFLDEIQVAAQHCGTAHWLLLCFWWVVDAVAVGLRSLFAKNAECSALKCGRICDPTDSTLDFTHEHRPSSSTSTRSTGQKRIRRTDRRRQDAGGRVADRCERRKQWICPFFRQQARKFGFSCACGFTGDRGKSTRGNCSGSQLGLRPRRPTARP